MEFTFNVNILMSQKITKIRHNLLPEGFSGDHRSAWYVSLELSQSKVFTEG